MPHPSLSCATQREILTPGLAEHRPDAENASEGPLVTSRAGDAVHTVRFQWACEQEWPHVPCGHRHWVIYELLSWVPAGDRPVLVWAAFWPVVLYRTRGVFSHLSPAGTCGPTVSPAGRLRRVSSARGRLCGMITVCSSLGSVDQAGAFQTPPPFDANVFGPSSG